jgi:hypothetical protein
VVRDDGVNHGRRVEKAKAGAGDDLVNRLLGYFDALWWRPWSVPVSARAMISDSRQQVVLGPNLIPLGYLPALTPFHHDAGEIGSSVRTSLRRTSLSVLSISVKGLLCNLKSFYLVKMSNIVYLY